jgi:hypothetical protein
MMLHFLLAFHEDPLLWFSCSYDSALASQDVKIENNSAPLLNVVRRRELHRPSERGIEDRIDSV